MTDADPDLPPPEPDSDPVAERGEVPLASREFKTPARSADSHLVDEGFGGRPRLDWSPVTDSGGGRSTAGPGRPRSGFAFDLGGALARLGGGSDSTADSPQPEIPAAEAPAVAPIATPPTAPPDPRAPIVAPVFDVAARLAETTRAPRPPDEAPMTPLPRRGAPAPAPVARVEPAPRAPEPASLESGARSYVAPRHSVFDDQGGDRPTATAITPTPPSAQSVAPVLESFGRTPTVAPSTVEPGKPEVARGIPSLPSVPIPTLPNLPPPAPARPAVAALIESAPSVPNTASLRAVQARAKQQQKKRGGKAVGKALLAIVLLGVVIVGSLTFGRSRLFPNSWDPALTPIVDAVQQAHGSEFEHTIVLVRQPIEEYQVTANRLLFGDDWVTRVPEWRALGLTAGDPNPERVGAEIGLRRLALYDADADRILMASDADPAAAATDLRVALEAAFDAQQNGPATVPAGFGVGLMGVSPPDVIVRRAVARFLAERADPPSAADAAEVPAADVALLPLPLEYELAATEVLGEALLRASGADTATFTFGSELPPGLPAGFDDAAATTTAGVLQVGERSLADPISIGVDDWSLVWGTGLPADTVDRLTEVVGADSYRPFDRGGVICVAGVFETANPTDAGFVLSAMATWAASAPVEAQATVSSLSDTLAQLISCDPGIEAAVAPQALPVSGLLDRQLTRLNA
jgi:hypothetical protein